MRNKAFLFILLLVFFQASCKQNPLKRKATIVFYNVENLFDTIDDPAINDEEFLPEGPKQWDSKRYDKKVNDIAEVLASINKEELPELIGLCEVENLSVLKDLVKTEKLAAGKYRIIHLDSPDNRGIDVALLYRQGEFRAFSHDAILVNPGFNTRDILYVYGKLGKDEMHIFVNHWPSRVGGVEKSEPNRIMAAETLKEMVDDILKDNALAKIIIMGDMNDEPDNKSLSEVLEAAAPDSNARLFNLMFPLKEQNEGSYNYQGNWNMLDNIVVSISVIHEGGFVVNDQLGQVFHEPWMEYTNKNGDMSPNRTYGGQNYFGGVSDHFPVYVQLER
jgi:predicted extracellular nuclease